MPQAIEKKQGQRMLAVISTLRTKTLLLLTLARELVALVSMVAALGTGFLLLASALSSFN